MPENKHQGFNLLELLLVLAIATLIIISSLRAVQQYQRKVQLHTLEESLKILFAVSNDYYFQKCNDDFTPPDFNTLKIFSQQGGFSYQEFQQIQNPYGGSFVVTFTKIPVNNKAYEIQISADFPSANIGTLQWIASSLNADTYTSGTTLSWTRLPQNNNSQNPSILWLSAKGAEAQNTWAATNNSCR